MSKQNIIRNIDFETALSLTDLVQYQQGQVVSKTFAQNPNVSLTLFAFDKGEEISSHKSNGDAMVIVLDGTSEITIGDNVYTVSKGETIVMPANVAHALYAKEPFKMLLTVIF